jgi:hypothetical protein
MIRNLKLTRILKIIALGLLIPIIVSICIDIIEPDLEFKTSELNWLWSLAIKYLCIVEFLIVILILRSFSRTMKWILLILGIPTVVFTFFLILFQYAKIEYEPHTDRYIAYKNLDNLNQYIMVQDYVKWKPNRPTVDTTLIDDYYFVRKIKYLDSMNVQGTWIRIDPQGNTIDTIMR